MSEHKVWIYLGGSDEPATYIMILDKDDIMTIAKKIIAERIPELEKFNISATALRVHSSKPTATSKKFAADQEFHELNLQADSGKLKLWISYPSQGSGGDGPKARTGGDGPEANLARWKRDPEIASKLMDVRKIIHKEIFSLEKCKTNVDGHFKKNYVPSPTHPFYNELSKAKVPITAGGQPDMLLHNLDNISDSFVPKHIDIEENDSDDVDITEFDDQVLPADQRKPVTKLREQVDKKNGILGDAIVCIGVSGCSKTRTIYELLCSKLGLYFTAEKAGNGGSFDMESFVKSSIREVNISPEQCENIGYHCSIVLLLSRLLVLEVIASNFTVQIPPFYWLMLQIKPELASDAPDFFEAIFRHVLTITDITGLQEEADRITEHYKKYSGSNLVICADESHVLLAALKNTFESLKTDTKRPLFSKFAKVWMGTRNLCTLFAGTGLKLKEATELVASAFLKLTQDEVKDMQFVDFGMYDEYNYDSFCNYMRTYLGELEESKFRKIFSVVQGRYRYSAHFVRLAMKSNAKTKDSVINEALQLVRVESITHIFGSLDNLKSNGPGLISTYNTTINPLDMLQKLVACYYLLGGNMVFSSNAVITLVETTLIPLSLRGASMVGGILEPLTAAISREWLNDNNYSIEESLKVVMGSALVQDAAGAGTLYERFVIPLVIEYLSPNNKPIDEHSYFQTEGLKEALPKWFRNATFDLSHSKDGIKLDESSKFQDSCLLGWLEKQETDIYLPENTAKPDVMIRIKVDQSEDVDPKGKRKKSEDVVRMSSWQIKLLSAGMTLSAFKEALETTNYKSLYTTKSSKIDAKAKDAQRLMENHFNAQSGMLRILLTYPKLSPKVANSDILVAVQKNDVIIFLNPGQSPDLFGKSGVWKFLHDLQEAR